MENKKYSFTDFTNIMSTLRSDQGCPWDRAQTHKSLASCLLEETCEAITAIHIYETSKSGGNLCEELGDLLMQIVLHSCIAKEEKLFTLEDVIEGISEKMIRRHPRVFGNDDEAQLTWAEIKAQEKKDQNIPFLEDESFINEVYQDIFCDLLKSAEKQGADVTKVLKSVTERAKTAYFLDNSGQVGI